MLKDGCHILKIINHQERGKAARFVNEAAQIINTKLQICSTQSHSPQEHRINTKNRSQRAKITGAGTIYLICRACLQIE